MISSDSSSSVRVISSPGSGGASRSDPEAGSSGASSRPPSPVDARVLRDLEVMKADHDLDTTVTGGSLAVIRERYNIPIKFRLHVPQPGQCPYSLDAPGMCISVDALVAGLRFSLHPLIEECLRWWRISPSQVVPNSWCYLVVFLGECREAGITPTWDLFMAYFRLCKSRGGYYLTVRVDQMDLDDLRGMPKMSNGKAPLTRAASPAREMALFDRVHDAGRLITFMDYRISQLQQELDTLKSSGGPEAVAKVEECASELGQELKKTKRERDEALLRLEASEKDLSEVLSNLAEVQRLLKEARVRARKMDDELLQAVKALENARTELPRKAIV
ncbi:hypothetical protein B296_00000344 [Ensete ventricosum]|uniref:Transposase (putative) gypsy type domain-containing protein n=1 Tax=Ensete ventricosum TaxID=4639 RepID=A0A427B2Q6_ENSVE|nr:hypothetical protein B296_00000344 [Ensete ventricosum]